VLELNFKTSLWDEAQEKFIPKAGLMVDHDSVTGHIVSIFAEKF